MGFNETQLNKVTPLAIAAGYIKDCLSVNKFGRNTDIDSTPAEDVWDGGGTWVAPTQARTHQITSTDTGDTSDGAGARTMRVIGLTGWDADGETQEDITLNGTSNVATANQYVIIHRMYVLTKGATSVNIGVITATADTDSTVTAQINAGQGQTQMAVYGVPSTHHYYMTEYYASINKASATVKVDLSVLVNTEPDTELTNFVTKHTQSLDTGNQSYLRHEYNPYAGRSGPAIVKMRADASANNTDISAGFDLILVKK